MEKGENTEETALREVAEECGIGRLSIVKPIIDTYHCYILDSTPILKHTKWFEMTTDWDKTPVPQIKENITEIRWSAPGELDYLYENTYPSIMEVLKNSGITP
jgi:8-oxo-dGTP pyrophosphatase MutT (NUDIX family)